MKRRRIILKVVILLIAGAAVNVAVAWGCVRLGRPGTCGEWAWIRDVNATESVQLNLGSFVPAFVHSNFNGELAAEDKCYFGMRQIWYMPRYKDLNGMPYHFAVRIEAGWPLLSVQGLSGIDPAQPVSLLVTKEIRALKLVTAHRAWPYNVYPWGPLWPGFAVNTLFYAGVLWVLFAGPFALRRIIRRRRGQCPHCAYPIGLSNVCTECGAAVDHIFVGE